MNKKWLIVCLAAVDKLMEVDKSRVALQKESR
jgi:hypothetical protein